jgi:tetratricopeptide (TPR) repeat protein
VACLDEQTVLALVEGQLADPSRRETESHLDACPSCLALVAEAARAVGSEPGVRTTRHGAIGDDTRYELGAEIARGGMGRIHEAFDRRLGRHVAIKCALRSSPALAARFEREVALTSRLEHPAIVPIHDAGTLENGTAFYAMRLVVGRTLDHAIADAATLAQRLALVPSVIAVADAMAYAHSRDIIHRDLKPQNIVLGEFGETVLLDWGLAKDLRAGDPDDRDGPAFADGTNAGDVFGTRGYMAPEQANGEAAGLAADVYGLGATLHHVLCGEVPRAVPLPLLPADIVPDLVAIVARATAEDPRERYASARELAADLHRFQAGRLVEAHRYTAWQLARRWIARHRAAVAVATVAIAVIATLSAVGLRRIVAEHDAALHAQARAEAERDAAEGVVGFMVGDMHDRLEGLGRLDLLTAASQRVVDYYARLGHAGQASAIDHHLAALQALGDARKAAGDHAASAATFREELALARAANVGPRVCWALVRLGQEQRALGKVDDSQASFRECAKLAHDAAERDTEAWARVRAAAGIELAKVAWSRHDLDEARRVAAEVEDIGHHLAAGGVAYGNVIVANAAEYEAQWAMEQEDWTHAKASAEIAVAAARQRPAGEADSLHDVASALMILALVQDHDHDRAADASFTESRDLLTTLTTREPANVRVRRELANVETLLGRRLRDGGDPRAALPHLLATRAITQTNAATAATSPDAIRDFAVAEIDLGQAYEALHEIAPARDAYRGAISQFERVLAIAPDEKAGKLELMNALATYGELEVTSDGDHAAARKAAERGLAVLGPMMQGAEDPELSELHSELVELIRRAR